MSNMINSLLETANPYTSLQKDAAKLAGKWGKSGLLEGISNETDKSNMAIILENQAKQLVVESSATGTGATFQAGTGEQYAAVALPLVRKVFGQLAAKEFVSVQPMSLPAGLVFFLDFQYGSNVDPFSTGSSVNSLYGNQTANFGNDRAGGLYGAGRFGYSINPYSSSAQTGTQAAALATNTVVTASWGQIGFDADLSASVAAGQIKAVTFPTSSISGFDNNGIRAFSAFSASALTVATQLPQFTQLELASGQITFFYTASTAALATASTMTIQFQKAPTDRTRGDFEDNQGAGFPNAESTTAIQIPEINVQMRSEAIVAKTRKLKAQWTPEFSQDLNAFHSLDAEAELTSILSEYISLEIDLEILDMLIQNVPTNQVEYWSAKVGNSVVNGNYTTGSTAGLYYTQMSWFQTLGIKLQKISNIIHQRTLRGGANFIVVSPTVATVLESIPGFAADTDGDVTKMNYAFGVQKIGALNSRYKVYKNPYMLENTILMGFRGNQFLESGAVYAPYVPLIMTPLVYDPNTFTPRKGIMTRYAKKMVRPEFYGKVVVIDTNVI
jgi:hypothetical protein